MCTNAHLAFHDAHLAFRGAHFAFRNAHLAIQGAHLEVKGAHFGVKNESLPIVVLGFCFSLSCSTDLFFDLKVEFCDCFQETVTQHFKST